MLSLLSATQCWCFGYRQLCALPCHSSTLSFVLPGLVYIVVPNVMGIAVYSPPLDSVGNSVRAITFFKHLMEAYPCGIFDSIVRPGQQLFGAEILMFKVEAKVKLSLDLLKTFKPRILAGPSKTKRAATVNIIRMNKRLRPFVG